jgi:hypothetical protein
MGGISDAAHDHSLMAIQSLTLALRLPAHSNRLNCAPASHRALLQLVRYYSLGSHTPLSPQADSWRGIDLIDMM